MGVSSTGNSIEEAHQGGVTGAKGYLYGIGNGLSEVVVEKLMGGIPGLSNVEDLAKNGFKAFVKGNLTEGIEEVFQNYINYGSRAVFEVPTDFENMHEDAAKSFYMGVLASSIMNGGSVVIQNAGQAISLTTEELSKYIEQGDFKNEEFLKALVGREVPFRDGNSQIDQKLNTIMGGIERLRQTEFGKYFSSNDINRVFDHLVIYESVEELRAKAYERNPNGNYEKIEGYVKGDKVHLVQNASPFVIAHEALHVLGRTDFGTQRW